MNAKFKKLLKRTAIVTTGVIAFGGTLVGGYLITPNRSKLIDVTVTEREKTLFERFVEKLTKDVGMTKDEQGNDTVAHYIKAQFAGLQANEKFNITYKKDKDSTYVNTIAVTEGELDLRMTDISLRGVEFNIDLDIDYNGKSLPVTLGHFGDDIYFGIKDLKIKFSDFTAENLSEKYWFAFAAYANLDSKAMMKDLGTLVSDKLGGLLDDLMNGKTEENSNTASSAEASEEEGFDFSSLLSDAPKESTRGDCVVFSLGETEKIDGLVINLVADEDDLRLRRVELSNLSFGTVTINGAIDVSVEPYSEFESPALGDDYIEVFNYTSLTGKVLSLLNEDNQKLGLEFGLDLNNVEESVTTDIAHVRGSINVDFDKLLDLSQYNLLNPATDLPEDFKVVGELEDVGFNFQLDLIGQNNIEYANLDFAFADGEGFLRFNEYINDNSEEDAVLRLHFDTETTNWIMTKIPELIDGLSQDENTDAMETLTSFLSDDLAEAVSNYDFSFILDMLDKLKNDANGFELGINLSQLGLGDDAYVDIRVDNDTSWFTDYFDLEETIKTLNDKGDLTPEEEAELDAAIALFSDHMSQTNESGLKINVSDIAFGNFTLDANLKTAPFKTCELGETGVYQTTKFIPGVVDQVTNLIDTKRTGFSITGSMKDDAGLGIDFSGQGRLDNNEEVKEGYGNMVIKQYKYHANQVWATHNLNVNVTNLKSNISEEQGEGSTIIKKNNNLALFVYGDPNGSCVKGKMKLQTFVDIFDIIKTFISEEGNNPKYTKFLAPVTKLLGMSSLGDILENKDYLQLAGTSILKKIDISETGTGTQIRIVINKNMLGLDLPQDIAVCINTKYNAEGKDELHSLVIEDLVLSNKENASKLNLTFELEDYENGTIDRINKNDSYMNLDGIKTLLDLGINTTKVNFYHLTANAVVNLNGSNAISLDLEGINFYVYVDGVRVKVYGTIDSVPKLPLVTDNYRLKDLKSEFTFETYDDNSENKVGGIFNIKRYYAYDDTERVHVGFLKWETHYYHVQDAYYYRSDSENFLDNIAKYLLTGLIGVKASLYESALNSETSSSGDEKPAGDFTKTFTDTGFSCDNNGTIRLGLNLNELTGISALKELEATITQQHITYDGSAKGLDILNSLHATLRVNFAAVFNINVTLDAAVAEAVVPQAQALIKWNAKAESGFAAMVAIEVPQANYNNPDNPYHYEAKVEYYK